MSTGWVRPRELPKTTIEIVREHTPGTLYLGADYTKSKATGKHWLSVQALHTCWTISW